MEAREQSEVRRETFFNCCVDASQKVVISYCLTMRRSSAFILQVASLCVCLVYRWCLEGSRGLSVSPEATPATLPALLRPSAVLPFSWFSSKELFRCFFFSLAGHWGMWLDITGNGLTFFFAPPPASRVTKGEGGNRRRSSRQSGGVAGFGPGRPWRTRPTSGL